MRPMLAALLAGILLAGLAPDASAQRGPRGGGGREGQGGPQREGQPHGGQSRSNI